MSTFDPLYRILQKYDQDKLKGQLAALSAFIRTSGGQSTAEAMSISSGGSRHQASNQQNEPSPPRQHIHSSQLPRDATARRNFIMYGDKDINWKTQSIAQPPLPPLEPTDEQISIALKKKGIDLKALMALHNTTIHDNMSNSAPNPVPPIAIHSINPASAPSPPHSNHPLPHVQSPSVAPSDDRALNQSPISPDGSHMKIRDYCRIVKAVTEHFNGKWQLSILKQHGMYILSS